MKELEVKHITITPEQAREWLEYKNPLNRRMKAAVIKKYAVDMKNGNWDENTLDSPIAFNEDGVLVNGEHRLRAIVSANIPVKTFVAWNVSRNAYIWDDGGARNYADKFRLMGMDYSTRETSLAKFMMQMLSLEFTSNEMLDFLIQYEKEIRLAAKLQAKHSPSTRERKSGKMKPSIAFTAAAFCALRCGVQYEELESFAKIVSYGFYDEDRGSCAVVFRNQMNATVAKRNSEKSLMFFAAQEAIENYIKGNTRRKTYKGKDVYFSEFKKQLTGRFRKAAINDNEILFG